MIWLFGIRICGEHGYSLKMVVSSHSSMELKVLKCLNDGDGHDGLSFNRANFRKWEFSGTNKIPVIEFTKLPLSLDN